MARTETPTIANPDETGGSNEPLTQEQLRKLLEQNPGFAAPEIVRPAEGRIEKGDDGIFRLVEQARSTVAAEMADVKEHTDIDEKMYRGGDAITIESFKNAQNALITGVKAEGEKFITFTQGLEDKIPKKAQIKNAITSVKVNTEEAEEPELTDAEAVTLRNQSNRALEILERQVSHNLSLKELKLAGNTEAIKQIRRENRELDREIEALPEKAVKLAVDQIEERRAQKEGQATYFEDKKRTAVNELVKPVSGKGKGERPAYKRSKKLEVKSEEPAVTVDRNAEIAAAIAAHENADLKGTVTAETTPEKTVEQLPGDDLSKQIQELLDLAKAGEAAEQVENAKPEQPLEPQAVVVPEIEPDGNLEGDTEDLLRRIREGKARTETSINELSNNSAETQQPETSILEVQPEVLEREAEAAPEKKKAGRPKKVEAIVPEVESGPVKPATREHLMAKYAVAQESTYSRLRQQLPSAFHGVINKFEARAEAKSVSKLSERLANIKALTEGIETEKAQLKNSLIVNERNLEDIKKDPKVPEAEKAHIIEELNSISEKIKGDLEAAEKRLGVHNEAYDKSRAEMNLYRGRRDEAISRVESKLDQKIAPREAKIEQLSKGIDGLNAEIKGFEQSNNNFKNKLEDVRNRLFNAKGLRAKWGLKSLVKEIESQIAKNDKLINEKSRALTKLETKLMPLQGSVDRWKVEKDAFSNLREDSEEKYPEREEESNLEKEPKAEKVESYEANEPEQKVESETSENEGQPEAQEPQQEQITNTVDTYVSSWNAFTQKNGLSDLSIDLSKLDAESKKIVDETLAKNTAFNANNLELEDFQRLVEVVLPLQLLNSEMAEAVKVYQAKDPEFKVTPEWEANWKKGWNDQWKLKGIRSWFIKSARYEQRKALEQKISDALGQFSIEQTQ